MTKARRASRIATFQLAGVAHDDARVQMELTVEQYRRARRWLRLAVTESLMSEELLTVDESLRQYADRHVERVLRVGLLKDQGCGREQAREQLGITDEDYGVCAEWWRDAQATG
jgi:hypothetical protein